MHKIFAAAELGQQQQQADARRQQRQCQQAEAEQLAPLAVDQVVAAQHARRDHQADRATDGKPQQHQQKHPMQALGCGEMIMGVAQVEHRQRHGGEHLVEGDCTGFADERTAEQQHRNTQQAPTWRVGCSEAIDQHHNQRRRDRSGQPRRQAGDLAQGHRQQPRQQGRRRQVIGIRLTIGGGKETRPVTQHFLGKQHKARIKADDRLVPVADDKQHQRQEPKPQRLVADRCALRGR